MRKMRTTCRELQDIIQKNRYEIINVTDDKNRCIIDFRHPGVSIEPPVSYYLSSVSLNKDTGSLETTVRSKVEDFKELYLDYCCEDSRQMCRPHVNMTDRILSVEARFHRSPAEKFDRLLNELR